MTPSEGIEAASRCITPCSSEIRRRGRLVALSCARSLKAFSMTLMVSFIVDVVSVNTAWTSSSRNTNAIAFLLYLFANLFLASYDAVHVDGSFFYDVALW